MGKTITYDKRSVFVSDEVADFLEADRKRQAAEERSDRRHTSKSSSETVQCYYNRTFGEDVADIVFRNLLLEKLREAISMLPAESQEMLTLYYYDEQTMDTIGKYLGISKAAVSKRIKKILVTMRSLMETWGFAFVFADHT